MWMTQFPLILLGTYQTSVIKEIYFIQASKNWEFYGCLFCTLMESVFYQTSDFGHLDLLTNLCAIGTSEIGENWIGGSSKSGGSFWTTQYHSTKINFGKISVKILLLPYGSAWSKIHADQVCSVMMLCANPCA